MVLVAAVYAGDPADADDVLAPYRQLAEPLHRHERDDALRHRPVRLRPLLPRRRALLLQVALHRRADRRRHRRHGRVRQRAAPTRSPSSSSARSAAPSPASSPDDSAYPHRRARFNVEHRLRVVGPGDDDAIIGWARQHVGHDAPVSRTVACTSTSPASTTRPTSRSQQTFGPRPGPARTDPVRVRPRRPVRGGGAAPVTLRPARMSSLAQVHLIRWVARQRSSTPASPSILISSPRFHRAR